ncbi:3-methyladenine DNA glycosylase 2 [Paenarthrobacter sp. DKR-5]|uniref:DNA-3-methyladenine glycosylase family protein n=1 Tax=Paenarthrobacter sp. DKR-5 TaxID=2835535 RepID=UPI001BDD9B4E|nr:AlkA N-terminal domain-containing protein [Paenarthrobacter sp. DKR-5]MBT1002830.1 3-methyladenine DNA glycosylase 2 [Paenarthrobacter sp. DKR-5]
MKAPGAAGGSTTFTLVPRGAYDAVPLLAALGAHAIPQVERTDPAAGTHTRLVRTPGGPAVVTAAFGRPAAVEVTVEGADAAALGWLRTRCRQWLDTDTDTAEVNAMFGDDPLLGPLVRARPGLRILGYPDGFEAAAVTVLGQQVSLAACRTFAGRLAAAYGETGPHGLISFPAPEAVAAAGAEELQKAIGLTHARSRTLQALAEACADGLALDPEGDHAEIRRRLLALPGIGPWTADYLALRALGDRNAYPSGDLVLQRALSVSTAKQALAAAARWEPYRAYAVFHLWTGAAYL